MQILVKVGQSSMQFNTQPILGVMPIRKVLSTKSRYTVIVVALAYHQNFTLSLRVCRWVSQNWHENQERLL